MKYTILIGLFLITVSIKANAQDYQALILKDRQEKALSLSKSKFGPLPADQVQFLDYFPVDKAYQVTADVTLLIGEETFKMPTYDGTSNPYKRYAILNFTLNNKPYQLTVYQSAALFQNPQYKNHLFLPFLDLTNGQESYSGGRYIDLSTEDIINGKATIDFNTAYNPYCAYSNGYRCPVPPQENILETKIMAGEKAFHKQKNERPVDIQAGQNFSADDLKIINNGTETEKLRVLQITNEKDLTVLTTTSVDLKFDDPSIAILEKRMFSTVQDPEHAGVGIAAPQIGINKNLIVVQRFDKVGEPFESYINPKIIWRSKFIRKGVEGCLSIPDRREEVLRSNTIRLQYISKEGKIKEENIEGFTAVIFQHEVDHLYGILYPDRVEEAQKEEFEPLSDKMQFYIKPNTLRP
ncbi:MULTISPECIES: peptide deformylase [Sphingobacterium]|uniref:Peptide deformylase n=3 Tax=Sphingobacterium TaxID=28453 RepID=A0ABW5YRN7_9SPHI|nr:MULTISPECIES: peptide deformylase [unclassified Sphingobacterium]MBB2953182.1 peptide deformylase [Sphingobacterium sp. JUb56]MCS3555285.1 peptide deformylase [Sphingobacterium sp. JUb21]QQD14985.1 peptide deformylase [Sphingobacterium sp. UDSM-2020]TCR03568.1 peptide deformylase [Sphingobacterium sp. JUb20]